MRIHLIAVGGAVMHNLALALKKNGNVVTGSDDEIYNPARQRLLDAGILPEKEGWDADRISTELDCIILGMHARIDNPELITAQKLGIKVYSFPEFIYEHSKNKKRVVVAGSHGKTTTTSMIMHVLRENNLDFDYLVGAQLEGFGNMVQLSDAPIIIIEGDEYLSSAIDRTPKIWHYKPNISIITGIAWDHINVFKTFEEYVNAFKVFIEGLDEDSKLYYYAGDKDLKKIATLTKGFKKSYTTLNAEIIAGKTFAITTKQKKYPLQVFGDHNLANFKAAYLVCIDLGVSSSHFFKAITTFKGAARRLQILTEKNGSVAYLDFAHAPSKVKATVDAFKTQFGTKKLIAALELHTFSSLNPEFLPQYKNTLNAADEAVVFFSNHTFEIKKMTPLAPEFVATIFNHPNLKVFTDAIAFKNYLENSKTSTANYLFMTSGNFGSTDLKKLSENLIL